MSVRKVLPLVLCVHLVAACGLMRASTPKPPATLIAPSPSPSPTTAASSSTEMGCYYVWATQDLPELSKSVQEGLQDINAGGKGNAYAFGEDCVAADNSRTFLAMETDFRIKLPVQDLNDEKALGDLIAATMTMLARLPQDQIAGPQPGRVEFEFAAADGNSRRLTVYIARYHTDANGLSGAPLFRFFLPAP